MCPGVKLGDPGVSTRCKASPGGQAMGCAGAPIIWPCGADLPDEAMSLTWSVLRSRSLHLPGRPSCIHPMHDTYTTGLDTCVVSPSVYMHLTHLYLTPR